METHLFVNKPISPNKCRSTVRAHSLVNFHKITYACNQQPERETEHPSFLETLLVFLCPFPATTTPRTEVLLVTVPPPILSGRGGISGTETPVFLRSRHSSLGPTKKIKAPGLKFQMAEFLKKKGYGRSLEAFYSLSPGNWTRITPGFS